MKKDQLSMLCKPETLRIAANYVFDDQKDDFVANVFHHQDYLYNLDENLKRLAQRLKQGSYFETGKTNRRGTFKVGGVSFIGTSICSNFQEGRSAH